MDSKDVSPIPNQFEIDKTSDFISNEQKKEKLTSYYGIIFALLSAILLSISNVLVKKAYFFSGTDISLIRFVIQLFVMILIALRTKNYLMGTKENRKNLIIYGIFSLLLITFLFLSIKFINPSEVTALYQLNMIMVPIIARFILKEKFRIIFILSLVMSILGVIFIAQPSFIFKKENDYIYLNYSYINQTNHTSLNENKGNKYDQAFGITSAILAAFFGALSFVVSRNLAQAKVHYSVVNLYQSYLGIPISFLISLIMDLTGVQIYDMNLMLDVESLFIQTLSGIGSAVFGVVLQICLILAVKYEETLKVSMVFSNSLLFTFIFQYLILNINTNLFSTIGALLIFLSTLTIILIQMFEKKSLKKNQTDIGVILWKKYLFFKI